MVKTTFEIRNAAWALSCRASILDALEAVNQRIIEEPANKEKALATANCLDLAKAARYLAEAANALDNGTDIHN